MNRLDIINYFIKKYNFTKYLEIGVETGVIIDNCDAQIKIGIDINCNNYKGNNFIYCQDSNEYFRNLHSNYKFDIILIDGLHDCEQVFKDITNSIKHLNENGIIVLHDCNPPTEYHASPTHNGGDWNGTVYLGYLDAIKTYNLNHYTIDTDWGCGVIFNKNTNLNVERKYSNIDWNIFDKNRAELLNLISINDFYNNTNNFNNNGKVSFICTTYRRFRCVERIVAQYHAQIYKNKELIIFNTDEEYPIELGFNDDSIIIINNGTDYITGTPYENRGQICRDAVTHATGKYFMLADDDDIYLPWHMQQAVDGILSLGTDAWKPESSFFALTEGVQLSQNVMEASIIVKMNRIREIGFRTDITGYEGLSWVMKLNSEGQLDEHNKNYMPSYCFNWSDPYDMGGHKQSSFIDVPNNFDNHKLSSKDYANRKLEKFSSEQLNEVYKKYYDFIEDNLNKFNQKYYEKYARPFSKKNKKIKFIIPIPDVPYYLWQILVQINNFRKIGYEVDAHYPVCCFNNTPSNILTNLMNSNNIKSTFHLYNDDRPDLSYTASIKPWLMSKYFKDFPEEKDNVYIYLDPDVTFLKPIDWNKYTNDDIWYESDTCSYLDSKYIKSKSDQLFVEMCDIVGISPQTVVDNDLNCGGAQYITKNNTWQYWSEVEKTSVPLFKHMVSTAEKYKTEGQIYPIQAWTSEMWTTNWILWKNGIETKCINELNFHWANHHIRDLKYSIYHNAGVVENNGEHFSKTAYQRTPFKQELKGKEDSISYKYIEEIKNTENNFPELIGFFD